MEQFESFVSLDLETTGLDFNHEKIMEIGLVLFEKGDISYKFSKTINPGKTVSDNVLILTGITQEELNGSEPLEELIPTIKDFIKDKPIVGHNIDFDINFLRKHIPIENPIYDTLVLSKIYLPFAPSHKLLNLAEYLNIPYEEGHRALADAEIAGNVFLRIFELMTELDPYLLKTQLDLLSYKYPESEIIKKALEISLHKGLNRKPYPYNIPVNFRENRKKGEVKKLPSVKDYFNYEGLETRPSQVKMAELVDATLRGNEFLLIESSSGTGKSLAYLIPSILISRMEKKPIYISSYTKTLQDQLFTKDIPFAEKITGCGVNTVLRKGRSNYLCLKKLKELPKNLDPVSLCSLFFWSSITKTGDLSEISYLFRDINKALISMDESCNKESCPYYDVCFYYKMKNRLGNADLILVNHALFFTGKPDAKKVIFDEAHELESAATSGFSTTISFGEIQGVLSNIIRGTKDRKISKKIVEIIDKTKEIFQSISAKVPDRDSQEGFYNREQISSLLFICEELEEVYKLFEAIEEEEKYLGDQLQEIIRKLKIIIEQDEEDRVFYYRLPNKDRPLSIELIAAPLDISSYLREALYPELDSFVMTSATLTVGESFDFIKEVLGLRNLGERLKEISLPETYRYKEQALTIIPTYLSDPGEEIFIEEVGQFLVDVILPSERGTLVLFTSYKHMKGVYQKVLGEFDKAGRELLIQTPGKSRKKLLKLFEENRSSVLLGTGSFWQGIDVPGESLEIVIIEKLPFPNPSEPIIGARAEYFEKRGLGGFSSYILPLSVLRLKQGFGRLIRSTKDTGVVFILDKRVLDKFYGSIFLESLPTEISIVHSSLEAKNALRLWFEEGKIYRNFSEEFGWESF
ncbi:MAG: helicase C-terminal domain-containing protein [candidate division WOR-3 bacterium]